ncbi:lipase family protein [Mycetocola lacteus]|nr:lipase family protein [Mycetocola lacteus]
MKITVSPTTLSAGSLALLVTGALLVPAGTAQAAIPPAIRTETPVPAPTPAPASTAVPVSGDTDPAAQLPPLSAQTLAGGVDSSFYDLPVPIPATPGQLVRHRPVDAKLITKYIPVPAQAELVMYSSTASDGTPNVVTGTVFTPWEAYSGTGERPLVSLAPGTQGLGQDCTPSRQFVAGTEYEAFPVTALLIAGYSVVVTDYQGAGTTLNNSYLARVTQGNAVLDAARAAPKTGLPSITPTAPVLLYGYSQGGGAVASAAELAASYAPELPIIGGFAGGVPADLNAVASSIQDTPSSTLLLFALTSLGNLAGINADDYLNESGQAARAWAAENCVIPTTERYASTPMRSLTTTGESITALIDRVPEFKKTVAEQTIGLGTPNFPILVGQSPADEIIQPAQSAKMVEQWCSRGAQVQTIEAPPVNHVMGAITLVPAALNFLYQRVNKIPAAGFCGN